MVLYNIVNALTRDIIFNRRINLAQAIFNILNDGFIAGLIRYLPNSHKSKLNELYLKYALFKNNVKSFTFKAKNSQLSTFDKTKNHPRPQGTQVVYRRLI